MCVWGVGGDEMGGEVSVWVGLRGFEGYAETTGRKLVCYFVCCVCIYLFIYFVA